MGKARNWRPWLFIALACLGGCSKQDTDKLTRIAQKSGQKLDNLTGGMRGKVTNGWQAMRGSIGEATLDSRVSTRLKWDKGLVDSNIQVRITGANTVELNGSVVSEEQRRRAVELANSTDGVASVTDSMLTIGQ